MTAQAPRFRPQGVGVEGLAGTEGFEIDPFNHGLDANAVMTLARQETEAREGAERIDTRQDRGGESTARWPECDSPLCAGPVPVDVHDCAVDEGVFKVGNVRQNFEQPREDVFLRPSAKPLGES